jgi:hypothetical protein
MLVSILNEALLSFKHTIVSHYDIVMNELELDDQTLTQRSNIEPPLMYNLDKNTMHSNAAIINKTRKTNSRNIKMLMNESNSVSNHKSNSV